MLKKIDKINRNFFINYFGTCKVMKSYVHIVFIKFINLINYALLNSYTLCESFELQRTWPLMRQLSSRKGKGMCGERVKFI